MKQWDNFPSHEINGTQIGAFQEITSITRQAQIVWRIIATMLPGDDVFDMEGEVQGGLWQPTVLTSRTGTIHNQSAECSIHHFTGRELAEPVI